MSLIKQHLYQQQEEEMNDAFIIYLENQRRKTKRQRAEQARESSQRSQKN